MTGLELSSPMFSVDGDGDVPMIDLLDRTPAMFGPNVDTCSVSTRSTAKGCGKSETCFGAVRQLTE
jgi:hypothetical protein